MRGITVTTQLSLSHYLLGRPRVPILLLRCQGRTVLFLPLDKLPKRGTRDIAAAAISLPLTRTLRPIIQATCSHQHPMDHYSPRIVRRLRLPRLMTLPGIDTQLHSLLFALTNTYIIWFLVYGQVHA